jgi:hypothetical protein
MSISSQYLFVAPVSADASRNVRRAFKALWARAIRPAWIVVGISAVALCTLCVVTPFDYGQWPEIIEGIAVVAALVGSAMHFAGKAWPRTALCLEAMALAIAVVLTVPPLASILASAAFPYRDAALLNIDRHLGINWLDVAHWFRDHPALSRALSHVYVSIAWQPALLVAALAYADPERLRRMLSASALALSVTILSSCFCRQSVPTSTSNSRHQTFRTCWLPAPG